MQNDGPEQLQSQQDTAEKARARWERPALQRLGAGLAENGFLVVPDVGLNFS